MFDKMKFSLVLVALFVMHSLSGVSEKIVIRVNEDNKYFICNDNVLQYRIHHRDGSFYRYIAHKTRDGGVSYKKEFLDSLGLQRQNTVYCKDNDVETLDNFLKIAWTYTDESYSLKNSSCSIKGNRASMNEETRIIDWGYGERCGSIGPIVCVSEKQKIYTLENAIKNWFGKKCDGRQ